MKVTLEYPKLNYRITIDGEKHQVDRLLNKLPYFALNELNDEDLKNITIYEENIR